MPVQSIVKTRPKLAVYKFSSCDGCQLSLLNLEDELLDLVGAVDIAYFLEARRETQPPPYDIGLVEGSISTPEEAERIKWVRRECKYLVSIGACATSGGIQALRNWADVDEYSSYVYPHPEYIEALDTVTPIATHVFVDFELRGCPVNERQLLELISAVLVGRRPNIPSHALCVECKREGHSCVMVSKGEPCLGPATHAGCGALCPSVGRGCYGCFGPMEAPEVDALGDWFARRQAVAHRDIAHLFRNFNGYVEPFKQAGEKHERQG
jgi:coenzyme F420-reducing hydrogenase gamma subunit